MSCNTCAKQASGVLAAVGVPPTQVMGVYGNRAFGQTWEYLPRCPGCKRWVSPRHGICNYAKCKLKGSQVAQPTGWPPEGVTILRTKAAVQAARAEETKRQPETSDLNPKTIEASLEAQAKKQPPETSNLDPKTVEFSLEELANRQTYLDHEALRQACKDVAVSQDRWGWEEIYDSFVAGNDPERILKIWNRRRDKILGQQAKTNQARQDAEAELKKARSGKNNHLDGVDLLFVEDGLEVTIPRGHGNLMTDRIKRMKGDWLFDRATPGSVSFKIPFASVKSLNRSMGNWRKAIEERKAEQAKPRQDAEAELKKVRSGKPNHLDGVGLLFVEDGLEVAIPRGYGNLMTEEIRQMKGNWLFDRATPGSVSFKIPFASVKTLNRSMGNWRKAIEERKAEQAAERAAAQRLRAAEQERRARAIATREIVRVGDYEIGDIYPKNRRPILDFGRIQSEYKVPSKYWAGTLYQPCPRCGFVSEEDQEVELDTGLCARHVLEEYDLDPEKHKIRWCYAYFD